MSSYFNDDQLDAWRSQDKLLAEIKQLREQLAAANERAERAEADAITREWQDKVREVFARQGINVDGGGCESGDPFDFTMSEIGQGVARLVDRCDEAQSRNADLSAQVDRLREAANAEAQHMEAAADVTGDKVHEKWLLERARALRAAIDAARVRGETNE